MDECQVIISAEEMTLSFFSLSFLHKVINSGLFLMRTGSCSDGLSGRKSICNPLHEFGLKAALHLDLVLRLQAPSEGIVVVRDTVVITAINRNWAFKR